MKRSFDVARIDIDDVKLTVVFLPEAANRDAYDALLTAARRKGMGEIALVWPDEHGRTHFIAMGSRHRFLQTCGYDQLRAQINAKLELG